MRDRLGVTGAPETPGTAEMADQTKESTEMLTIDCPFCAGEAATDEALTLVACDGCGVTVEVAPDPARVLAAAA